MKTIQINWKNNTRLQLLIFLLIGTLITSCSKEDDTVIQEGTQSNENKITSFIFLLTDNPIEVNVIAAINNTTNTITAFVPQETDVTGLLPEIKVSPKAQISTEVAQDFTGPVSYVVMAEDGSKATYEVTVAIALSQREILQAILDANPNHTLDWDLETTENLGDLTGVTINTQGRIIELVLGQKNLSEIPPEIGQLTNLKSLSFSENSISVLPNEIFGLATLERLSFAFNQITSIPSAIENLVSLKSFGANFNNITEIPVEITKLSNLEGLSLAENDITILPPEIGQLTQLKKIALSNNKLIAIPPEIGDLKGVTDLDVAFNLLNAIPKEIGNITNLESLRLSENKLTSIPKEIAQLINLRVLEVSTNQLTTLPEEIGNLTALELCRLDKNNLTTIPAEIGFLLNLSHMDIRNNTITGVPNAICNLENFNGLTINKDLNVSCITSSIKDALIQIYSANPENTLGWGVDNFPGVAFNSSSNPTEMIFNNKNLTRLPESMNVFGDLEVLSINNNTISSFPEVNTNLLKLTTITAASNNFTTVPESFQVLTNLTLLSITNNPISTIPQGVCDLQIANGGVLTILTDPGEGCL